METERLWVGDLLIVLDELSPDTKLIAVHKETKEVFAVVSYAVAEGTLLLSIENTTVEDSDDVASAKDIAVSILDDIRDEIIPEAGEDFADSVGEKALGILENIEYTGTVSDRQIVALENMRSGLDRWLRD